MLSKNHHHRATFGSIQDDEEQVFLNEKKTTSSSSSLSSSSSYGVVHKFALTCLLAIVGALAFLGNDNAFVPAAPMNALRRLGAAPTQTTTITLTTGCSPIDKLTFSPGKWKGIVGAKLVTKSMSNDFLFSKAQDMKEVSCGTYEGAFDIKDQEEFGFFLYPIGEDLTDVNTVLDNGCMHEGDSRCPSFAVPAALAGFSACTSKYEDPGNGNVFYNRIYDGATNSFTWGSCDTTCATKHPVNCDLSVEIQFDILFSGAELKSSDFDADKLKKLSNAIADSIDVEPSTVEATVLEKTEMTEAARLGGHENDVEVSVVITAANADVAETVENELIKMTEAEEVAIATSTGLSHVTKAMGDLVSERIIEWHKPPPAPHATITSKMTYVPRPSGGGYYDTGATSLNKATLVVNVTGNEGALLASHIALTSNAGGAPKIQSIMETSPGVHDIVLTMSKCGTHFAQIWKGTEHESEIVEFHWQYKSGYKCNCKYNPWKCGYCHNCPAVTNPKYCGSGGCYCGCW